MTFLMPSSTAWNSPSSSGIAQVHSKSFLNGEIGYAPGTGNTTNGKSHSRNVSQHCRRGKSTTVFGILLLATICFAACLISMMLQYAATASAIHAALLENRGHLLAYRNTVPDSPEIPVRMRRKMNKRTGLCGEILAVPPAVNLTESSRSTCLCNDPLVPTKRIPRSEDWIQQHQQMVLEAKQVAAWHGQNDPRRSPLHMVMLGDSITQRLNGTITGRRLHYPEGRIAFDQYFINPLATSSLSDFRSSSGNVTGMALGYSGDTSPELLWHLQHGILSSRLDPLVWVILIGTNDLGRTNCSKISTLKGIKTVVRYLHRERPSSRILLHGLLPRNDFFRPATDAGPDPHTNYLLGWQYDNVLWINYELSRFCQERQQWCHYMEANDVFLHPNSRIASQAADSATSAILMPDEHHQATTTVWDIDPDLMPDALHPNVPGYLAWLPRLADRVAELL